MKKRTTLYLDEGLIEAVKDQYGNVSGMVSKILWELVGAETIIGIEKKIVELKDLKRHTEGQLDFLAEQLRIRQGKTPRMQEICEEFNRRKELRTYDSDEGPGRWISEAANVDWCQGRLKDARKERPDIQDAMHLYHILLELTR